MSEEVPDFVCESCGQVNLPAMFRWMAGKIYGTAALPSASLMLRYDEAAEILGISVRTLRDRVAKGEIAVVMMNRRSKRIAIDELQRYIERRTTGGPGCQQEEDNIRQLPVEQRVFGDRTTQEASSTGRKRHDGQQS